MKENNLSPANARYIRSFDIRTHRTMGQCLQETWRWPCEPWPWNI